MHVPTGQNRLSQPQDVVAAAVSAYMLCYLRVDTCTWPMLRLSSDLDWFQPAALSYRGQSTGHSHGSSLIDEYAVLAWKDARIR